MKSEAGFAAALLDPSLAVPEGLVDGAGRAAGKRFSVYRNNVVSGLTGVLEAGFPAVRKLVGDAFFAAMAGVFVRQHPPQQRIMMLYGSRFPDFLASFPPVAHLGYLPGVARLELGLRHSYHAADTTPVGADLFAAMAPEALPHTRLILAPSLRLIRSRWPVLSIWQANTQTDAKAPDMREEDVLITRAGFDPVPQIVSPAAAGFLAALIRGQTIGAAMEDNGTPEQDLTQTISLLLRDGCIIGIEGAPR